VYSREIVDSALQLAEAGHSAGAIAQRLNVTRRTVHRWLNGFLPHSAVPGICDQCLGQHDFSELPREYLYVLGLYLGDGYLAHHARRVYRLRITLDAAYPGIIEEAVGAVTRVAGRAGKKIRSDNCVEVASYWRQWLCHLPQHGAGPKHLRPLVLAEWQEELVDRWPQPLLRGLIHSDGCRFVNTGRGGWSNPRYTFFNKSADIADIFRSTCERIGVHWTSSGPYTTYVSRKADVALLDEFIGPKS